MFEFILKFFDLFQDHTILEIIGLCFLALLLAYFVSLGGKLLKDVSEGKLGKFAKYLPTLTTWFLMFLIICLVGWNVKIATEVSSVRGEIKATSDSLNHSIKGIIGIDYKLLLDSTTLRTTYNTLRDKQNELSFELLEVSDELKDVKNELKFQSKYANDTVFRLLVDEIKADNVGCTFSCENGIVVVDSLSDEVRTTYIPYDNSPSITKSTYSIDEKGSDFRIELDIVHDSFVWRCSDSIAAISETGVVYNRDSIIRVFSALYANQNIGKVNAIISVGMASSEGKRWIQETNSDYRAQSLHHITKNAFGNGEFKYYTLSLGQYLDPNPPKECDDRTATQRRLVIMKVIDKTNDQTSSFLTRSSFRTEIIAMLVKKSKDKSSNFKFDVAQFSRYEEGKLKLVPAF